MAKCPIAACAPLDASPGCSAGKQPFEISHRTTEGRPGVTQIVAPRDVSDPGADRDAPTDRRISGRE
jgi:hypothetical protein